uniref:Uncharacterized protein n=1 Tax=Leptobrachium leishanense TaxID=445787 RepID=A0A8C5MW90_9ANUR
MAWGSCPAAITSELSSAAAPGRFNNPATLPHLFEASETGEPSERREGTRCHLPRLQKPRNTADRSKKLKRREIQDGGSLRSSSDCMGDAEEVMMWDSSHSTPATEKQTQALLQDLRTTIQADFRTSTADIHRDLGDRVEQVETKTDKLCLAHELIDAHTSLKQSHEKLLKVADIEDRSRCNNIRIRGIPETVRQEALMDYLYALFQVLLPDMSREQFQLDRAHRLPKLKSLPPAAPRDTILRVHFYHVKDALMAASLNCHRCRHHTLSCCFSLIYQHIPWPNARNFCWLRKY